MLVECVRGKLDLNELYNGAVVVLRQLPAAVELVRLFDAEFAWQPLECEPHRVGLEPEVVALCRSFEQDPRVRQLYTRVFKEAGMCTEGTHWDRVRLRVQQPGAPMDDVSSVTYSAGRYSSTLPIHRDTWASNVMCQANWWMPLRSITEERTMWLYPSWFSTAVTNSSCRWDLVQLKHARHIGEPYPQMPVLEMDQTHELEAVAVPLVVQPGDVVVFSGAHLHGSGLNVSSKTRFSTECRTVHAPDVRAGVGAPNVDGRAPCKPVEWFTHVNTGAALCLPSDEAKHENLSR
eukprot:TRINITY_DN39004_c0_g1_i1.p1 TRINITY_DN39004_c0_g1~~TRINITY_DN39004_c0_g1_i1.p1  ORF type:complete len:291 (-),score=43.31 TRINITY_DN39004_c0_g1_i1:77-949(-)